MSDDDSWEVRAFEEDTTGNALGCTWPPRSYSCTFCRREFRSAQALGGHMNVHRRDRAKLHDAPPSPAAAPTVMSNGFCLLYPLPNPTSILFPSPPIHYPFPPSNKPAPAANDVVTENSSYSTRGNYKELIGIEEELDLELRLGPRQHPPK
ncbi:hypothetical protein ACS0TY_011091 [Phlomoides rotata]